MFNIHIDIGYSYISPYSIMILLSLVIGIAVQYRLNIKRGVKKNYALYLLPLGPLMSIEGGLLLTYITSGRVGLSSIGGVAGMYAAALVIGIISRDKYSLAAMLDNCTLVLPLIYSVSKVGCLLGGCCYGIAYHGPLCVEYSGSRIAGECLFPVQLAETVVFLVIFIIGMHMMKKFRRNTVYVIFMLSASAKFLLDFLRYSHNGRIISVNQALCLAMMLIMVVIIVVRRCNYEKMPL